MVSGGVPASGELARASRAGFENKRRVAAEIWDRCGEPSLPVIDRSAAPHQALRASAKNSRRLKERGRPAHRSCFDVGGSPTRLEFSALSHFSPIARATALAAVLLAAPCLHAANYRWDTATGDSAITDGSGTWQVGVGNWYDGTSYDQNWANGHAAIFGNGTAGAAGTVTLGGNISLTALTANKANGGGSYTFDLATYTLNITATGGGISLTSASAAVFNNGTIVTNTSSGFWSQTGTGANGLTINSKISGSGRVYFQGGGDQTLNNSANDFTGILAKQNSGTVILQDIANTGVASSAGAGNTIEVGTNGGGFRFEGAAGSTNRTLSLAGTAGNVQIQNNGSGALNFTGAFSNTKTASITLTLNGTYNGVNDMQSAMADNGANVLSITKSGSTTWQLSGSNTYTGATTINAGTLTLSGGSAIADTGAVTLANATATALNVNASETIGNLSGGGTLGGNIAIAASQTLTVNQTTNLNYNGTISGDGGLTKNGTAQLTLRGNNTFTGMTTVNNGILRLENANNNSQTIVGNITVSGGNLTWASSRSPNRGHLFDQYDQRARGCGLSI